MSCCAPSCHLAGIIHFSDELEKDSAASAMLCSNLVPIILSTDDKQFCELRMWIEEDSKILVGW